MWMRGLAVLLAVAGLLAASVACSGEGSSRSDSETPSPEGVTWVLQALYGVPVLDGTFVWLRLDGDGYEGLDGCNRYGGQSGNGTPVVGDDGELNALPIFVNAALCEFPAGIMEQADEYRRLLGRQGQRLRVEGDRLEVLDWAGEAGMVFVRQVSLAGKPVNLARTEWQLVVEDRAGGQGKAATIAFVDDHLAVGTTVCRGYVAFYRTSDERVGFPATSMTEYGTSSSCAEESRRQEGQFTDDLSQAIEYSVNNEDGTKRLRIRTSRGRTVTFEPLSAGVESVFDVGWSLTAFVMVGKWGDPDAPLLRVDRLIPGTDVTARFHEEGASGFGGCNFYGARLEPEEPIAREDGTFATGLMAIESTAMDCNDPPGVTEQEKRFTELIPRFKRYRIYGELLVVHTNDGVVLLFRYE